MIFEEFTCKDAEAMGAFREDAITTNEALEAAENEDLKNDE